MKVLLLSDANSIHTVRWANALTASGCEISLVHFPDHKNTSGNLDRRVALYQLPYSGGKGYYYLNALALRQICRQVSPDVVNAHYALRYGTLMRLAHLKHTVLSVWGRDVYDIPYVSRRASYTIRKNLNAAQMIASTSYCMAEQTRRVLGRDVSIAVTPFGVDLRRFSPSGLRGDTGEFIIGCVKTLEEKYGMEYLIRSIRLLLDSLDEGGHTGWARRIRCRIYGDGSQRKELEELIASLDLTGIASLMGPVPHSQVPEVLSQMDIFCVASISESFGVAAVEASAMALPVVVSDADGFREVVEDGVTGLIVPRKDAPAMAKALERLVLAPELRTDLGAQGRKRVEALYDWEKNVEQMLQVYRSVINSGRT